MATWRIEAKGSEVVLTYRDAAGCQECGRGGLELLQPLTAWVFEQAIPWDRLRTARGSFVKQVGPNSAVAQMLS
jgi:hypothetical protein